MKLAITVAVFTLATFQPASQSAFRSPPPAAGSRQAVVDTATSEFEANGLHVILRRNTATDVVAANLFLLGGVQQLTPPNQGIEALLLAASGKGSRKFPGPKLREEISRLGSEISIGASEDFSTYRMKAIRSTFDSTWALYADRLLAPT